MIGSLTQIYCQKWTYKVDYTRVNEFGQGGEGEGEGEGGRKRAEEGVEEKVADGDGEGNGERSPAMAPSVSALALDSSDDDKGTCGVAQGAVGPSE